MWRKHSLIISTFRHKTGTIMIATNYETAIQKIPTFPAKATNMLVAEHEIIDDARFCSHSTLVMRERKYGKTFQLSCHQLHEGTLLGRSINTDDNPQYLDMTPLGGEDLGVSRLHTYLCYEPEAGAVLVTDLGSTNGTFMNDRRLGEREVYMLRHGDRLRLGKLEFAVTILHWLSELEIAGV